MAPPRRQELRPFNLSCLPRQRSTLCASMCLSVKWGYYLSGPLEDEQRPGPQGTGPVSDSTFPTTQACSLLN